MTTISMPDIIVRCIANDRAAQHELFHLYKQRIHDLTYKSLGNKFDVEDVIQQVFIALFASLRHFKGESSLDTWVYRITVKVCTTQLRKKYRKRQPNIVFDAMEREHVDPASSDPAETMEKQELSGAIHEALDKLSIDKRMIVIMYEMDGLSLEEIANVLKKPLGTVKSRLFHGRKALEKQLRGYLKP
jgi:RNA polymerase sigma-70 factor, ECF subfamily